MWKPLLLVLAGCATCTKPAPTRPINLTVDVTYCDAAQAQLLKLVCKDGEGHLLGGPNSDGVSFGDRCRLSEKNGVPMAAQCISTVNNCNEVDPCLQSN